MLVVVPFSVCEQAAKDERDRRDARARGLYRHGDAQDAAASPLLQLRWLRLVVDEGHELAGGEDADLGAHASHLVSELFAERRWVVSGTPTTGDVDDPAVVQAHLGQLQRLLRWLRHPRYGLDVDPRLDDAETAGASAEARKRAFDSEIAAPFRAAMDAARRGGSGAHGEAARAALVDLLKSICVRHRKTDLSLPPPIYENVEVEVVQNEGEALDTDAFQWRVDEALAARVAELLDSERSKRRRPKIAVFSQHNGDLASVAEALYARLGGGIAEFDVQRLGHGLSGSPRLVCFPETNRGDAAARDVAMP